MKLVFLFLSVFLASIVEFVEALTIVPAVGITRQWRSTFIGVGVATLGLAAFVGIFGVALVEFVPLDALRVVVGTFLLIFGLQWIRKAVLRAAGRKGLHDEDAIFAREREEAARQGRVGAGMDWYAFTVACKGVFLEGAEVAFIVVTFGSNARKDSAFAIPLAAAAALAAAVIVVIAGLFVHKPLSTVPENTMKFGVGLMLAAFGAFWAGEGIGAKWPGDDIAIPFLIAGFLALSWLAVIALKPKPAPAQIAPAARAGGA